MLNKAGYFTLPTQYNVAVALTKAQINTDKNSPDYLLQDLDNVYTYGDTRTYPLSSYSYMIIPTAVRRHDDDDGQAADAGRLPLLLALPGPARDGPDRLLAAADQPGAGGFDQIAKLKKADPGVDLTKRNVTTCHNPTFVAGQPTRNYLAEIAPKPPACDKAGAGPCTGDAERRGDQQPAGRTAGDPAAARRRRRRTADRDRRSGTSSADPRHGRRARGRHGVVRPTGRTRAVHDRVGVPTELQPTAPPDDLSSTADRGLGRR